MKYIYCANCGLRMAVIRKALPKFGRIIDLIEPHECLDEPMEFDLAPIDVSVPAAEGGDKFVQNLNKLNSPSEKTFNVDPGDRRKTEDIKRETSSTAPLTLLDSIKLTSNTTPVNDIKDEPEEG